MGVEGEDGEDEDEVSTVGMVVHCTEYTMMFKSLCDMSISTEMSEVKCPSELPAG